MDWPVTAAELVAEQRRLASAEPPPWHPAGTETVAGCFVCFDAADRAYAGAALVTGRRCIATAAATGSVRAGYRPGLLALREGPVLAAVVRRLPQPPDVLLVNATGRDHPRRAGLAVHLGAVLELPTVGVTHRPLLAAPARPDGSPGVRGQNWPLHLDGEEVARWLVTRSGVRPVVVHAGWRTSVEVAVGVVLRNSGPARTPAPLRRAREVARQARSVADRGPALR